MLTEMEARSLMIFQHSSQGPNELESKPGVPLHALWPSMDFRQVHPGTLMRSSANGSPLWSFSCDHVRSSHRCDKNTCYPGSPELKPSEVQCPMIKMDIFRKARRQMMAHCKIVVGQESLSESTKTRFPSSSHDVCFREAGRPCKQIRPIRHTGSFHMFRHASQSL